MADQRPSVISLYSGAGGLDYGFEAAGFDTRVALEFNHDACETLRRNRSWPVIESDILEVSTAEILARGRLKIGEPDVLMGGPPCQPFSKSGYWASGDSARLDDPRSSTLGAYLRVLREARPKTFLLENVTGLAFSGKDEGLQLLLREIQLMNREVGTNYRPKFRVMKAVEYGVPQQRERVFIVGSRDGSEFQFPTATHRDPAEAPGMFDANMPVFNTCWNALADVAPLKSEDLAIRGKWADLLPSIPEGNNYLWHTERGGGVPLFGWRRRYWCFLLKLAKDRPSWTLQAQPGPATGPFHWDNRRLSMRELCRLQTFPDDVEITGNYQAVHKQVGNAVPSLLAEVVARSIRAQFLGLRKPRGELKLLPPNEGAVAPPAKRLRPVAQKYLSLVGEHEAHPGTGKGYGAVARASAAE